MVVIPARPGRAGIGRRWAVSAVTAANGARAYAEVILGFSWIKTVSTFHPGLSIRAALVAGAGAALGLLALANLSTVTPPRASADKALSEPAPVAVSIVSDPLALARQ
jgi:hypothetical protein